MTIYQRIKYLRNNLNMSQQELAEKVGFQTKSAVSKIEKGDRDINQSMIVKFAEVFGVTPTYLLFGEETNIPPEATRNEEDEELIKLIRLMPPEMKAMYKEALRAALKSQGLI